MNRATVQCPNCQRSYAASPESLGGKVVCRYCQQTFTVQFESTVTASRQGRSRSSSGNANDGRKSHRASYSLPADVPNKIGKYELRGLLGAGAMGEVYRAWDPLLARAVAIKLLPRGFSRDRARVKRFQSEARAAASLSHTNVVSIFEIGQDHGRVYIAMQYVDGPALDEVIPDNAAMEWREATHAIRDAAAGLEEAHKRGIVHRDVKPANLIRDDDGTTRVVDFGLAKMLASNQNITQDGAVLGTPAFMAPEQWLNERVDNRSDLHALVLTYFYLLTGTAPFEAPELLALRYQHAEVPIPDPRGHTTALPAAVCEVLIRGSQKAPECRYQGAGELIGALDAILAKQDSLHVFGTPWEELVSLCESEPVTAEVLPGDEIDQNGSWRVAIQSWAQVFQGKAPALKWAALGLLGVFCLVALGMVLVNPDDYGTPSTSAELQPIKARSPPLVLNAFAEQPKDGLLASLTFSPDTCTLAVGEPNGSITMWDSSTGEELKALQPHNVPVRTLDFSPDGNLLASAGNDGLIKIWRGTTWQVKETLKEHEGEIYCVRFSPNGRLLASGGQKRFVKLWSVDSGLVENTIHTRGGVWSVAFSQDGRLLAISEYAGRVGVWQVASQQQVTEFDGHRSSNRTRNRNPDSRSKAGITITIRNCLSGEGGVNGYKRAGELIPPAARIVLFVVASGMPLPPTA